MHFVALGAGLGIVSCLSAEHDSLGRGFAVGIPFDEGSKVTRHDLFAISRGRRGCRIMSSSSGVCNALWWNLSRGGGVVRLEWSSLVCGPRLHVARVRGWRWSRAWRVKLQDKIIHKRGEGKICCMQDMIIPCD